MKTYLKVLFASDGGKPSAIGAALRNLGFEPVHGPHDFVYNWPQAAAVADTLHFGDRIHAELQGLGCLFEMETI